MDINKDEAKGRVKEAAGALTDNDDLKREGKADQAVGEAQKIVDEVAKKVEQLVDGAKDTGRQK